MTATAWQMPMISASGICILPRPFFPGSILSQMYSTAPFRTNITPTKDVLFQRLK